MIDLLIPSFMVSDVSESFRSITKNEQMSDSLVFLSESLIFFAKNDGFAQKTDERILSPESSTFFCIPTVHKSVQRTLISYDSYDISRLDISSHPDGMDIHAFASMFKEYQELLLTTSSQSYCHLGNCGSDVGQEYDVDRYDVNLGPDR